MIDEYNIRADERRVCANIVCKMCKDLGPPVYSNGIFSHNIIKVGENITTNDSYVSVKVFCGAEAIWRRDLSEDEHAKRS